MTTQKHTPPEHDDLGALGARIYGETDPGGADGLTDLGARVYAELGHEHADEHPRVTVTEVNENYRVGWHGTNHELMPEHPADLTDTEAAAIAARMYPGA